MFSFFAQTQKSAVSVGSLVLYGT